MTEKKKKNLKDVTFCIPYFHDHLDRYENLETIVTYLRKNFDTNILVQEEGPYSFLDEKYVLSMVDDFKFVKTDTTHFHRTKVLNDLFKRANTSIVVNQDTDVVMPVDSYIIAANLIREKNYDFVFPYDGRFLEVPRSYSKFIREHGDVILINPDDCNVLNPNSVGGCLFADRKVYAECGYENTHFVTWGFEDLERVIRFEKLGKRVGRTPSYLIHIEHYRNTNSNHHHPFYANNVQEYRKILDMPRNVLVEYIKTFD